MRDRFPGYDVMSKRGTPSFNEATRKVLDARLAIPDGLRHFSPEEFAVVAAVAARLVPQGGGPAVPVAALVDHKLATGRSDGFRGAGMPRDAEAWSGMPPRTFFKQRLGHDIVLAYYSHPESWNQIGFGGPASPRGYVRMGYDERDSWEAAETQPGGEDRARRENWRA